MEVKSSSDSAPYLFVSYSRADAALVNKDIADLHMRGFRCVLSELLQPVAKWRQAAQTIGNAEGVILYLSPEYFTSPFCVQELELALEDGKALIAIHLFPTRLPSWFELLMRNHRTIYRYDLPYLLYTQTVRDALRVIELLSSHTSDAFDLDQLPTTNGNKG